MSTFDRGTPVFSMGRTQMGTTTGGHRANCGVEAFLGTSIGVRWPDGSLTFPCTHGMTWHEDPGCWEIKSVFQREWVFTTPDGKRVVGECPESECADAEDAMHQFEREYGGHFDVYFRTKDGELLPTNAESTPDEFPEPPPLELKRSE